MDTIWQIIVRLACPAVLRPWVNGDNTARDNHYGILVHILGGGTKHRTIQIQVMSHGSHGSMNITVSPDSEQDHSS